MPVLSTFRTSIEHRYFPVSPGSTWTYAGSEDGVPRVDDVRVLEGTRRILGVACLGIEQLVEEDGILVERTVEWYAQDADGNVWKFGEETFERVNGSFVAQSDSWIAGSRGARPWLAFPAVPAVGQEFVGGPAGAEDRFEVVSIGEIVTTPLGAFPDCVRLLENPDDPEDTDIILYADGVGMVAARFPTGGLDLVAVDIR